MFFTALALPFSALADITSGINWLATQPNANGSFGTTPSSLATPLQSTAEVLRAYQVTGQTAQPAFAPALGYLNADPEANTEFLARKVLVDVAAGGDVSGWVSALLVHQFADGGFGDAPGYGTTVFDTAQALQALAAANYSTGTVVPAALGFLLNRQQANGGWRDGENETSVFLTAQAIRALTPYRSAYVGVSDAVTNAQNYLLTQRNASGLWSEPFESALVLTTLIPVADFALLTNSVDALQAAQLANGSWVDDSYTTALAVHAF